MLIKAIINKALDLKELDELENYRVSLNKVIRKHRRKLIRLKIYINWENKYKDRKLKLYLTRLITLTFNRDVSELTISFNRLTSLISALNKATRDYNNTIKYS